MKKPLVSIITVNYNQTGLTLEVLEALEKLTYPNIEIIVVDNDSREDPKPVIMEKFPHTIVINSEENLGFAGGNNLGVVRSKGDYVFFVNNDIDITPDAIERILEIFDEYPDAGVVSPKFHYYYKPGIIEYAGYHPVNTFTARNVPVGGYEEDKGQHENVISTNYAHGGGMFVSRKVIDTVGMMPELYFLYYEEFDWCEQIKKAGFKIYYQPKATIFHKSSETVGKVSRVRTYYLNRSRILFMRRNVPYPKFLFFLFYFTFATWPVNVLRFILKGEFGHVASFNKAVLWNLGLKQFNKP